MLEYVIGVVAASLGFVGGTALSYSKVSGLYERVAQQEKVIAELSVTMRKIAAVLEERWGNSGRELIDLANDTLARHEVGREKRVPDLFDGQSHG